VKVDARKREEPVSGLGQVTRTVAVGWHQE